LDALQFPKSEEVGQLCKFPTKDQGGRGEARELSKDKM